MCICAFQALTQTLSHRSDSSHINYKQNYQKYSRLPSPQIELYQGFVQQKNKVFLKYHTQIL